jgi:hypothetical protein
MYFAQKSYIIIRILSFNVTLAQHIEKYFYSDSTRLGIPNKTIDWLNISFGESQPSSGVTIDKSSESSIFIKIVCQCDL